MKHKKYKRWKHSVAFIGIDNGTTGAVAIHTPTYASFCKTPVVSDRQYTKKPGNVTRLDGAELYKELARAAQEVARVYILLERPIVNPRFFIPTMSAVRCLEATLIVLSLLEKEYGNIYYRYIDSKEWQSQIIPRAKGDNLKEYSTAVAITKFPQFGMELMRQDGDALCILLYMLERKKWLGKEEWRIPDQNKMVKVE